MAQLQLLKTLDASKNPLGALPDCLAQLPVLVTLSCGGCGLRALPAALGSPGLAVLSAPGNSIAALPAGLARCGALIRLDLQGNALVVSRRCRW
jgi:Leucine-rich repeat (LRR) protein